MDLSGKRVCITGGGGFLGSHLADRLVAENDVVIVDRFGNGRRDWVPDAAEVVAGDLRDSRVLADAIDATTDLVFHFAANKAVDADAPREQFTTNVDMTSSVLARMHDVDCTHIAFSSSSTIYGEAPRPTPEDHGPVEPISRYGAAKVAEEALMSVSAHTHAFTVWNFRLANVVGPRLQRGAVIPDFIVKLRDDPSTLEILGDGRQAKSYIHVTDCLDAIKFVIAHTDDAMNTFNLGTRSTTSVRTIGRLVADEMGLDPAFSYTGGDRGWDGDVPRMQLSIEQLASLGWEPSMTSDEAVRQAIRELIDTPLE